MKKTFQLGLWMDSSIAYLIEFTTKPFEIQTILSEFPIEEVKVQDEVKNHSLSTFKNYILNKYYGKIGQAIVPYKKITLFGPSPSKIDFFDFLSENEQFLQLRIEIKDTAVMNVNQQHAFIRDYIV